MSTPESRRTFIELFAALSGATVLGGPLAVKWLLEEKKTPFRKEPTPPQPTRIPATPDSKTAQPPATSTPGKTEAPKTTEVNLKAEWDASTYEALRWVAQNRPFKAPYDKYTMRLGIYPYGLHGMTYDYSAQANTRLRIWWGEDLVGVGNKTIHAPFEGVVAAVGEEINKEGKSYGFWIDIKSPNSNWWYRAHHVEASSRLKTGTKVTKDQAIATESAAHAHTHNGLLWKDPKGVWQVVPLVEVVNAKPASTYADNNGQIAIKEKDLQLFREAQKGKENTLSEVPFFSQYTPGLRSEIVKGACGPFSLAMILAYYKIIPPTLDEAIKVFERAKEKGYWNGKTPPQNMTPLAAEYGVKVATKTGVTFKQLKEELARNPVIVAGYVDADPAKTTHYMVALRIEGNYVTTHDSATVPYTAGKNRQYPLTTFLAMMEARGMMEGRGNIIFTLEKALSPS